MFQFSDGVKKWAILLPTYPLPASLRVKLRRRYLSGLEMAKAERARMLIIGHPKSGNTWLKVMLSRLYQVRHGLAANRLINTDELARKHPDIPRLAASNGYYSYEGVIGAALAPDAPDNALRHKPVLFIARNPLDIAVSWYFQFTRRQSAAKQELINHFIDHPIDRHTVEMWEFVRHSDIGLLCLIDFLNMWERNVNALDRGATIRYEDLRANPADVLKQVVTLMGDSFSDAEIQEAVDFGSFDNLRQLESKGFFRQGGMKLRDKNDPNTFKVRRGKVGGYRDYFTPEQAAELEALVRERLSPTLGYTPAAADPEPVSAHA
ncbi:MAG: sulfotransferase domain-containing protein [Chromatiales bacterium]|nr:MAG: sulfotransferase domain-containing protein [Chromatiales bacterium]